MSHGKFVGFFGSILLLTFAAGTAWATEFSVLSPNPQGRRARDLSVVAPGPVSASPLQANEIVSDPTQVRTGIFLGVEVKVSAQHPLGQVQTGVFWSPQDSPGQAHRYSLGCVSKSSLFGIPDDPAIGDGMQDRHDAAAPQFRKRSVVLRILLRQSR